MIFVEIMLRQKHLTPSDTIDIGNWSRETLERNFELLLNYTNYMEEYEKPAICMFLICKAEFHLRSSQIMGDLPPEDRRPTEDDLQKAEACLKGVQMEIFPTQVNYYKAQYYLALSDLHLWRQEYSEAIVNVRNAKQQFLQGKITNDKSCIPDQRLKLLEKLEAYKDFSVYVL